MKKQYLYLLICIFILQISCSSSESESENQQETASFTIKVKEHKSNLPLQDVEISLYYCKYDNEFGCQKRLLTTLVTDMNGECKMTKEGFLKADEGFISRKKQYWDRTQKAEEIAMEPEAWVKITLKTNTTYPADSYLVLKTTSELYIQSTKVFKVPIDAIVDFRLFGNETNNISWTVYKDGFPPYCFSCEVLATGNLSLNPQKFETLTASINY